VAARRAGCERPFGEMFTVKSMKGELSYDAPFHTRVAGNDVSNFLASRKPSAVQGTLTRIRWLARATTRDSSVSGAASTTQPTLSARPSLMPKSKEEALKEIGDGIATIKAQLKAETAEGGKTPRVAQLGLDVTFANFFSKVAGG
jgi:hypothetical protein